MPNTIFNVVPNITENKCFFLYTKMKYLTVYILHILYCKLLTIGMWKATITITIAIFKTPIVDFKLNCHLICFN